MLVIIYILYTIDGEYLHFLTAAFFGSTSWLLVFIITPLFCELQYSSQHYPLLLSLPLFLHRSGHRALLLSLYQLLLLPLQPSQRWSRELFRHRFLLRLAGPLRRSVLLVLLDADFHSTASAPSIMLALRAAVRRNTRVRA